MNENEPIECPICMENVEITLLYQCCLQPICKNCYSSITNKVCPYCRETATRAVRLTPVRAGIQKRKKNTKKLLGRHALMPDINAFLESQGNGCRMTRKSIEKLRKAVEEYGVERMKKAQQMADREGKYVVRHL